MKRSKIAIVLFLLLVFEAASFSEVVSIRLPMSIDGKFSEWRRIEPLAKDSVKDVEETEQVDFSKVWAEAVGKNLYISYCCAKPINFEDGAYRYNVFIDADNDLKTGYRGWDGDWALGADYLIQGVTVFTFKGGSERAWEWNKGESLEFAVQGDQIEMRIPLSIIGLKKGQECRLLFFGDNVSQADYVPDDRVKKALVVKVE